MFYILRIYQTFALSFYRWKLNDDLGFYIMQHHYLLKFDKKKIHFSKEQEKFIVIWSQS